MDNEVDGAFDSLELKQASEPTQDELLQEAQAWGFDTIEEWAIAMEDAYREYEEEQEKGDE